MRQRATIVHGFRSARREDDGMARDLRREGAVLITGCSSGLGRALAETFSELGYRVAATARRLPDIEELASPTVLITTLDLTAPETIERAVDDTLRWAGSIAILINNGGYGLIGPVVDVDPADLQRQFTTNLFGPVGLIRSVVPSMVANRCGRIVNIGSVSGITATPFAGSYCASKAALHLLSDALRMEVAPFGIRVTTVQPGAIESRFAEAAVTHAAIDPASIFGPAAAAIEARARLSQNRPTPATTAARIIARRVTAGRPPAVLRVGRGARLLPALGALPPWVRDSIFSRTFELDSLRRKEAGRPT